MAVAGTALQVTRTVALPLLLWATAIPVEARTRAIVTASLSDHRLAWLLIVLLTLVFVIVMLAGRRRWHPWPVLALEGVIAGALAFIPPIEWVIWFGVGGSWVTAMGSGFAQALAMAWLGVVCFQALEQRGGIAHSGRGDAPV